jgi:hypothetical protein
MGLIQQEFYMKKIMPRCRELVEAEILTRRDYWCAKKGLGYKEVADLIGIPFRVWSKYGVTAECINAHQLLHGLRAYGIPDSLQLRPGDVRSPENCFRAVLGRFSELGLVVKNEVEPSETGVLLE